MPIKINELTVSTAGKRVVATDPDPLAQALARLAQLEATVALLQSAIEVLQSGLQITDFATTLKGSVVNITAYQQISIESGMDTSIQSGARTSIQSGGALKLEAGGNIDAIAGQIKGNTGMADFSGILRCQTIIAPNVIASYYTPGVGNLV